MKRKPLILVCRHEAAHAVAAIAMGHRVDTVYVNHKGGCCRHKSPTVRPDPMRVAIIATAGHAADMIWSRQPRTKASREDYLQVLALGFRGESVATILNIALSLCQSYETEIRHVASALKERGTLTGRDVRRIIREVRACA